MTKLCLWVNGATALIKHVLLWHSAKLPHSTAVGPPQSSCWAGPPAGRGFPTPGLHSPAAVWPASSTCRPSGILQLPASSGWTSMWHMEERTVSTWSDPLGGVLIYTFGCDPLWIWTSHKLHRPCSRRILRLSRDKSLLSNKGLWY